MFIQKNPWTIAWNTRLANCRRKGLLLSQHRAGHPAGADHAVGPGAFGDEVVEGGGSGCAVGIDVADEVGLRCELESLDQRTTLADWFGDVDVADLGELFRGALDDAERVVGAAIEHDDEVEVVRMMLPKVERVLPEHRPDAGLLVVGGDQQQNAGGVAWHADGLPNQDCFGNAHQTVNAPSSPQSWEPRYFCIWSMDFQRTEPSSKPTLPPSEPMSAEDAPSAPGFEKSRSPVSSVL